MRAPWRPAPPSPPGRPDVDALIEATRQENVRADAKTNTLLTIVGFGFAAFTAAAASTVAIPLRGTSRLLVVAALAGVCVVAELLLTALRPRLGRDGTGQRYFAVWRRYAGTPDVLAAHLSADVDACRTLIQLSRIVWRKYRLIRWAVDVLLAVVPLLAVAVSVALLVRG
ncbi:Pycsar system effector family protein [Actinomadura algeriensis]|uniref:Pycsar effector protein domain-containing protein n=1 Tax=Actinomadura algeriensis TaxID=1679523 RepID=A0ABR9K1I7_9ACTN|nr:Pycsar system effector family protein [Actinomadura algeriensis]MBE1536710.1 hypothetical protein [Actinomadura algeriensis]